MIPLASINWLAVLVGVVVSNGLGFLWYGPLFGKTWLRLIGKRAEEIESDPGMYMKTALASAVAMIALNLAVAAFGATTFLAGFIVGVVVFIGFGATGTYVYTTFEGPPESVWLLYAAYQVIVFAVMGGVFALWV